MDGRTNFNGSKAVVKLKIRHKCIYCSNRQELQLHFVESLPERYPEIVLGSVEYLQSNHFHRNRVEDM